MKRVATLLTRRITSEDELSEVYEWRGFSFYSFYSQDESSEEFIGEWMETRGIRDQIVLATKVRLSISVYSNVNQLISIKFSTQQIISELRTILR